MDKKYTLGYRGLITLYSSVREDLLQDPFLSQE